jgi:hypothetical protein
VNVYGHPHPTYLREAAGNIAAKPKRDVAMVEAAAAAEGGRKSMRTAREVIVGI